MNESAPAREAPLSDEGAARGGGASALPAESGHPPIWRWVFLLVLVGGVASALGVYLRAERASITVSGLRAGGADIGSLPFTALPGRLSQIAGTYLDQPIVLILGDQKVKVRRREVGLAVDTHTLADEAQGIGRSGDPLFDLPARRRARRGQLDLALPLTLDRSRALDLLGELKDALDRAPADARLDLDHHAIEEERPGYLVQVYESLALLENAARAGGDRVELAGLVVPAKVTRKELADIDIGMVVGTWETKYSVSQVDSDRTYNLKVGADHLNGHILRPHELFSFNEVVGDRTEKEGYRVAPVIQGGELIDGLAGGMCQIASTLHAASFFAGLEIVSSTPHSRPSAYIPLGLDSTVVYPVTDLKIRNPFDFPIIMHYQVHQGSVKVELLGKEKPYKVVFEREILQETPFGSSHRGGDPLAPVGQKLILQDGYPGYKAIRRRYVFDRTQTLPKYLGGPNDSIAAALARAHIQPLKAEKWPIHYPSTELIFTVGTGPKKLKKKPPPPSHHIPAILPQDKPISRIVR